jgi:hypothetical protein
MNRLRLLLLAALGAAASAGGLAAQVRGLPVRNAGLGTGASIAGDLGFPNSDAGSGYALGATFGLGAGPIGFTVTAARFDPKGAAAKQNSFGGTLNLKVFGGPLVPLTVTMQGGLAYQKSGAIGDYHMPLGVGFALTIPNPAFSLKPWVAPRLDFTHTSNPTAAGSSNTSKFGISGGVDIGFLGGFMIRTMYDRVHLAQGINPAVVSVGLGLRLGQ